MKKMIVLTCVLALVLSLGMGVYAYGTDGVIFGDDTSSGGVIFTDETPNPNQTYELFDALEITKDPTSETKKAGEECVFTASANGAEYVLWYIVTPADATHLASEIPTLYKGVTVTGSQSNRLVIGNVTAAMNGSKFYATYTSGDLTLHTTLATLSIDGAVATPTPAAAPTPTPTPAPTPTPVASNGVVSSYGNGGGGVQSDGSGSFLGTNTQNYNANTAIGSDSTASEPTSGSSTANNTMVIENTSASKSTGAYILAAIAGVVIIGAVLVMILYMRGKISLGKFEKLLGNFGTDEANMFDDEQDFYDPDDFNNNHQV